jgi:hypothetical protein
MEEEWSNYLLLCEQTNSSERSTKKRTLYQIILTDGLKNFSNTFTVTVYSFITQQNKFRVQQACATYGCQA